MRDQCPDLLCVIFGIGGGEGTSAIWVFLGKLILQLYPVLRLRPRRHGWVLKCGGGERVE